MVGQVELAWRVLQIVALALPALAILLQVLTHLNWEGYDSTPHQYHISASMLFLIVPITLAGIIAAGVIAFSYDEIWIQVVTVLMTVSFLYVPLVLYSVYKRARVRNAEFLEQEKKAIERGIEQGEIDKEEVQGQIDQIETWQAGFLSYVENSLNRVDEFLKQSSLLFVGVYGGLLVFGIFYLIRFHNDWTVLFAIWLIVYPLARLLGQFAPTPTPDNED